jgi:hypothetical protein
LLTIHQGNYTSTGPSLKRLQLLWWESPPEHWTALREGCQMNFLIQPEACIHDNALMDHEQLDVPAGFVDELLELKIVQLIGDGELTMKPNLRWPFWIVMSVFLIIC